MKKVWKEKYFPTRRGALNFYKRKAVAELPTRETKYNNTETFKVKYLGRI